MASHDLRSIASRKRFGGQLSPRREFRDNRRVIVAGRAASSTCCECLKDECGFDMLVDLTAVDYLHYPDATDRFGVVYALLNTTTGERLYRQDVRQRAGPDAAVGLPAVEGGRLDGARGLRHVRHRLRGPSRTCAAS